MTHDIGSKIRPTPQAFKEDRDATGFFEEVRERTGPAEPAKLGTFLQSIVTADSTATTVSDLKDDFNTLLANLRAAGMIKEP